MSKNDGGPAFPVHDPFHLEPANADEVKALASGMSLRDYFAAKAMHAFIANMPQGLSGAIARDTAERQAVGLTTLASIAYRAAEAMIAARDS